mmetsp:Transcript_40707/g.116420  ORF Transcript_40707/g.116420 Transcript_40707/m.116420 type:complete len:222 (+) Transcript_40707:829-1494(+)
MFRKATILAPDNGLVQGLLGLHGNGLSFLARYPLVVSVGIRVVTQHLLVRDVIQLQPAIGRDVQIARFVLNQDLDMPIALRDDPESAPIQRGMIRVTLLQYILWPPLRGGEIVNLKEQLPLGDFFLVLLPVALVHQKKPDLGRRGLHRIGDIAEGKARGHDGHVARQSQRSQAYRRSVIRQSRADVAVHTIPHVNLPAVLKQSQQRRVKCFDIILRQLFGM